ncbi:MAG: hypothetical protein EOP04_07210 [Proteobacteria bacterium]|nr:MAG: hypothetical protein EOP04_07210 [Pseudomonadota bacterium]
MTTPKVHRVTYYFAFASFLVGALLTGWVFLAPSQNLIDWSALYGIVVFPLLILSLLCLSALAFLGRKRWHTYLKPILALLGCCAAFWGLFAIWDYSTRSILIKIVNNTGRDVYKAGIYGCCETEGVTLRQGESVIKRFPGNLACTFMFTYIDRGDLKLETLPQREMTTNIYYLGSTPDIELER